MIDSYIYQLLRAWGRYRRIGWNPRLGFDKVNNLLKVPGGEDEEIPEDVQQVDRFIGTLPREMRKALRQKYEYRRSLRRGAKGMEISKDKFRNIIQHAEQRITGYMERERLEKIA